MKYLLILFITTLFSISSHADEPIPEKTVQIGLQILTINNQQFLSLNFQNFKEWHTYWKNPGDAGLPIKTQFFLGNTEINLSPLEWPIPTRFIENGTQWAYGYQNAYSLFWSLAKNDLNKFSGKEITLKTNWLVCKNICIPGERELKFKIVAGNIQMINGDALSAIDPIQLSSRLNALPKMTPKLDYLDIKLSKGASDKSLVLSYEVKNTTDLNYLTNTNLLFPFPQAPFDFQHETISIDKTSIKGLIPIGWDGEYSIPPETLSATGKFKKPYILKFLFNDPIQKQTFVVEKKFDHFDLVVIAIPAKLTTLDKKTTETVTTSVSSSLVYYLALAFIGGLILNIMPCVLPIISIKLFSLIKYKNESRKRIFKHNLFYTLGILFTFILLASTVLLFKSFGSQVGWGFQLQSPHFIAFMIIILFVFALNMFGLFEFHTPGGTHLGNVQTKENFIGDFLGGVLATILSTPCSAPFLGTALTFAFTSDTVTIFSIFMMIGLGLAFPFIVTGLFPNLVAFIPKPGQWMNTVKKVLGFSLILTVFWLFDVYNALVDGSSHLLKLNIVLCFIFIGFFIKKRAKIFRQISFLVAAVIFLNLSTTTIIGSHDDQTSLIRDKQARGLNWEVWSYEKMDQHKQNQETVFIDFTAKWCFTCKVNEKLVLDTDSFKTFVQDNKLKLLIGDWTKRDEVIGSFLLKQGLVGVPAYFIQKKDGTLISLGETITLQKIQEHLN
jgi:thiol:disulfide interchange protein DsbD